MKIDEMIGMRFGALEVAEIDCNKRNYLICRCDCGTEKSIYKSHLLDGGTKSCVCQRFKIKDLANKRFGKLIAIKPCGKKYNRTVWLCKCDCGNEVEVVGTSLSSGNTSSCGCVSKPHGMFGTRIYGVWRSMKERCYVESNISYPNYGGRGIKVCQEWQEFIPFMEWSYANGYDENAKRGECTLDRIDVNGNYCPENCRWVSMSVQANNKTDNVYMEYNGIVDTLSNHARREGISPVLAETRKIQGKSVDEIFSTKCLRKVKKIAQYDTSMNLIKIWDSCKEIVEKTGHNEASLRGCLNGYSKTSRGYIWIYIED